jgi:hypothetical protein
MGRERRDYPELCMAVLGALERPKTIGELAGDVSAGWATTERALTLLESLGAVKKIVSRPRRIYSRVLTLPIDDGFINALTLITEKKGSRFRSLQDCLDQALRDFIATEVGIKRY